MAVLAVGGTANASPPPRFPPGSVWHENVAAAALHPQSASMITTLQGLGGWGFGGMQIDFGFVTRHISADETVPSYALVDNGGYFDGDCDVLGTLVPVPVDAAIEGQNYEDLDSNPLTCESGGDCHLLIRKGNLLYELYQADLSGGVLSATCLATWDLNVIYPPQGRGEHCTSADAAGFPIAPLLPNADEVAAAMQLLDGDLGHAIRFILPNARMASFPDGPDNDTVREPLYVRPASHAGGPVGPEASVPYGARLRLRADFDPNTYGSAAARVVLRTMQRYGIVLADGGNIALTFEGDTFTTAKWADVGLDDSRIFRDGGVGPALLVTDFEVIDTGPRIPETYECERTDIVPEPDSRVFRNGFESP